MGSTILKSAEETQALGESWAAKLQGGEIFALHGPLGAGKTQLVKGLARGLGFSGDVTSPTFTLVHEYFGGRLPVYHLDLYRLENSRAATAIGVEDYLPGDGVTLVEWPERIADLLPPETRHWELKVIGEYERAIEALAP